MMSEGDFQLGAALGGKRIVVAMSGGVDSSVVAALAARERRGDDRRHAPALRSWRSDRAHGSVLRRRRHPRRPRGLPTGSASRIMSSTTRARFRDEVIERFADEYLRGRTPIPCVRCNMGPKFTDLLAPGARARRRLPRDRPLCPPGRRARTAPSCTARADPARDQSYFLFATTAGAARFPALPARRPAQDAGARARRASSASASRPSPTARTSASSPTAIMRGWSRSCGPRRDARGEIVDRAGRRARRAPRADPLHRRPAPRPRDRRHSPSRSMWSGSSPRARRVVVGPKRGARGRSGARSPRSTGSARCIDGPLTAKVRSLAKPVAGRGWPATRVDPLRRARIRRRARARPRCSMPATACSAAAGSRKPSARSSPLSEP